MPGFLKASTFGLLAVIALAGPALAEGARRPGPGEALPGGGATARNATVNRNAFSHASGNLGFAEQFDFKIGNAVFRKLWVPKLPRRPISRLILVMNFQARPRRIHFE